MNTNEEDIMKKTISIAAASFLILGLSTSFAQAGAARRHTIEGFLLGTGVTLLGTAIVQSMNRPAPVRIDTSPPHHEYRHTAKKYRKGHLEVRKIWVDPVYETRWNPGHYNKRGHWVSGRHQEFLVAEGYWEKVRVWVRPHSKF